MESNHGKMIVNFSVKIQFLLVSIQEVEFFWMKIEKLCKYSLNKRVNLNKGWLSW